jgi:hypothetical protein
MKLAVRGVVEELDWAGIEVAEVDDNNFGQQSLIPQFVDCSLDEMCPPEMRSEGDHKIHESTLRERR